jgi:hypothetical protein
MRYIFLLTALFLLSGCALTEGGEGLSCPRAGFIADADTITFADMARPDGFLVKANIDGFKGTCAKHGKDEIQLDLTLPFVAKKYPQAAGDLKEKELPYFIAVLGPNEEILQRQAFSTKVSFDNANTGTSTEEHVVRIPVASHGDGHKYKVVIGFVLTPDQLTHNKD